jgi:hypothetical protein
MASYLLASGSTFTIATRFATLDTMIISGEVTIDNEFQDNSVWGESTIGKQEYRLRYQAIGNVRSFHDDTVAAAVAADFAPGTGISAISMTFVGSKVFACNAHIHNFRIMGNRQDGKLVEVNFNFRSYGDFTTVTL